MRHLLIAALLLCACTSTKGPRYDVVIRNGTIYDGSGGAPVTRRRRHPRRPHRGGRRPRRRAGDDEIDAHGLAVAPGFINMLSWATESLIADGRAQSDIRQGVTLEVFGEG